MNANQKGKKSRRVYSDLASLVVIFALNLPCLYLNVGSCAAKMSSK